MLRLPHGFEPFSLLGRPQRVRRPSKATGFAGGAEALELGSAFGGGRLSARSRVKVRSSRIQDQRLERLGRLDGLLRKTVRPFWRWFGLILRAELWQVVGTKPANSDRHQPSNNCKYDKNDDGPGKRATRPQ